MFESESGLELFGYTFKKTPKQKKQDQPNPSFVPALNDTGGVEYDIGGGAMFNAYSLDIDQSSLRNGIDLIRKYREMSLVSDIDLAIGEIIDEVISADDNETPIKIDYTEESKLSDNIKKIIMSDAAKAWLSLS